MNQSLRERESIIVSTKRLVSLAFITSTFEVLLSLARDCSTVGNTDENVAGDEIALTKYKSENFIKFSTKPLITKSKYYNIFFIEILILFA